MEREKQSIREMMRKDLQRNRTAFIHLGWESIRSGLRPLGESHYAVDPAVIAVRSRCALERIGGCCSILASLSKYVFVFSATRTVWEGVVEHTEPITDATRG